MNTKPKRGQDGIPEKLMDNEIAWREFQPPMLMRAVQDFALQVLDSALFGDPNDSEFDGVRWVLDFREMTAHMYAGDHEVVIVDVRELVEEEIKEREDCYYTESENLRAEAATFEAWAKRLRDTADLQDKGEYGPNELLFSVRENVRETEQKSGDDA